MGVVRGFLDTLKFFDEVSWERRGEWNRGKLEAWSEFEDFREWDREFEGRREERRWGRMIYRLRGFYLWLTAFWNFQIRSSRIVSDIVRLNGNWFCHRSLSRGFVNLRPSNLYTAFLDLWTSDFSHLRTFERLVWSPDFYESLNFRTFQSLNFPIFQSSNFQISELSKNLQIIVSQISFECPLSNPTNLIISSWKLKKSKFCNHRSSTFIFPLYSQ